MKKQFRQIASLLVLSTFLLSCGDGLSNNYPDAKISKTEAGNILIVTKDFSAIILTKEFMDAHAPWVPPTPPSAYWTPEIKQILYIESHLVEYLEKHDDAFNSKRAPNKEKLATYGRQYFGILNISKGKEKRGIIGSFFCSEFSQEFDWIDQVVDVDGGGDCFFGFWFDLDKQEFVTISAHSRK